MPVPRLPYELNPYTASFSMRVTNCQSECPFARRIVLTRDKCYRAGSCSRPPTPTSQEGRWGGDHRGGAEETKAFNSGWTFTLAPGVRIPSHPFAYETTASLAVSTNKSKNNNVDDVVDGERQLMPQG